MQALLKSNQNMLEFCFFSRMFSKGFHVVYKLRLVINS